MSTYKPVPDHTAGRPLNKDESNLFDWLRQHCEYRAGEKVEVEPILDGYGRAFLAIHRIPIAPRTILKTLTSLGFIVSQPHIMGVFLRDKDAVAAPPKPLNEDFRGGSAAPVNPDLYAANGLKMEMPKKPEVTFIEAGPMPKQKFTQDENGRWVIDDSEETKK